MPHAGRVSQLTKRKSTGISCRLKQLTEFFFGRVLQWYCMYIPSFDEGQAVCGEHKSFVLLRWHPGWERTIRDVQLFPSRSRRDLQTRPEFVPPNSCPGWSHVLVSFLRLFPTPPNPRL